MWDRPDHTFLLKLPQFCITPVLEAHCYWPLGCSKLILATRHIKKTIELHIYEVTEETPEQHCEGDMIRMNERLLNDSRSNLLWPTADQHLQLASAQLAIQQMNKTWVTSTTHRLWTYHPWADAQEWYCTTIVHSFIELLLVAWDSIAFSNSCTTDALH